MCGEKKIQSLFRLCVFYRFGGDFFYPKEDTSSLGKDHLVFKVLAYILNTVGAQSIAR
jgi:hypothetical protein